MTRIICHSVKQNAQVFKVVPTKKNTADEFVVYLDKCVVCNQSVLEIIRFDCWGEPFDTVRLKTRNISAFLDSMSVIWKPKKIAYMQTPSSRFVLGYNEFGVKKKCSQNISSLMLGKIETDPLLDLKNYSQPKELLRA